MLNLYSYLLGILVILIPVFIARYYIKVTQDKVIAGYYAKIFNFIDETSLQENKNI